MKTITTRVFACGGAGTNLSSMVTNPTLDICYLDTSMSNRTNRHENDKCYFIEGLDGSGANRKQNHPAIAREIDGILERFPPADFNIVVFAGAGGSGSVLGPLLIKQLLATKETFVAVVVGDDCSHRYMENTINTLKTLDVLSMKANQPIVMSYHQNSQGVSRGSVDQEVVFVIEALAQLANQNNEELDTADVTNWIQYHKVTSVLPQVSTLFVTTNRPDAMGILEPISIASLWPSKDGMTTFGNAQYVTNGFPRDVDSMVSEQLHYVINVTGMDDINNKLQARGTELSRLHSQYRQRKSIVDVDDMPSEDDIIL